ncbi:hypothetical protein BZB76_4426 [Actinomadura pelletieri DSM 43383]|uniref:Uncharacterized protein n=1 Tax=Actinomadura pelletieri DSM 43383 TaxID=1120940 RepID=A0A495QME1_9ACTN|nr:hypothetical protein [Actinomadura pelletieri]RKS73723.1 hypothetical protein BZB76_4426 [Actinomadura pelletieri DSM 43383]
MAVTDDQVAALHAQLAGRTDEHRRLLNKLDRAKANEGYAALITAAFFEATERRFIKDGTVANNAEVIDFVASLRATSNEIPDIIDPKLAELFINYVLGKLPTDALQSIDDEIAFGMKILLLAGLIRDLQFNEAELSEFLAKARADAEELFE